MGKREEKFDLGVKIGDTLRLNNSGKDEGIKNAEGITPEIAEKLSPRRKKSFLDKIMRRS